MHAAYTSFCWYAFSLLLSCMFAHRGLKKRSLSTSGALAAVVVGTLHMSCGFKYGLTLIAFYLSSSQLTKYKASVKAQVEENFKAGGLRNAVQGHYACCCADTWASEIGILSSSPPYLITTGRRVPAGTNGGVSLLGTLSAVAGGCFIGGCFLAFSCLENASIAESQNKAMLVMTLRCMVTGWKLVPIGKISGLLGSMLDSFLGATLQYSGISSTSHKVTSQPGKGIKHICGTNVLSNDGVNALSALLTSILAGCVAVAAL